VERIRRVRFRKPLFKIKQFAWEIFVRRTVAVRNVLAFVKGTGARRQREAPELRLWICDLV